MHYIYFCHRWVYRVQGSQFDRVASLACVSLTISLHALLHYRTFIGNCMDNSPKNQLAENEIVAEI